MASASQDHDGASTPPTIEIVPPQMDPASRTSTRALRQNPLLLLLNDAFVLLKVLPFLPFLFLPLRNKDQYAELFVSKSTAWDNTILLILSLVELPLLVIIIPLFLVLPGAYFL